MDTRKKVMKVLIIIVLVIFLGGTFLSFVSYLILPAPTADTGAVEDTINTGIILENTGTVNTGILITGEVK